MTNTKLGCIWRDGCNQFDVCQQAGCCQGLRSNREKAEQVPSKELMQAFEEWSGSAFGATDMDLDAFSAGWKAREACSGHEPLQKSGRGADEASRDFSAPTPKGSLPNSLGNEHLYQPDQEWMNAPLGASQPPPPEQEPKSFAPWRVPDPPRTDVAEALRPFVDLFEKSNERYRQRGGDPDQFKDTHPFREITAKELPLGVWRRAQAALRAASPPGARYPMINVPAITDAYESGFGHGKNLDDLPNPYSDGTHERQAYAIGYEEGERRRRVNGSSGYCNQGAHEHCTNLRQQCMCKCHSPTKGDSHEG